MEISPLIIGIIGIIVMIVLFFFEMPCGLVMALVGFVGIWYLSGLDQSLFMIASVTYKTAVTYPWSLIPLFIFMGQISYHCGLGSDLFSVAFRWLGRLRGGLAITTVGTSAGFAAVCGDNIAAASTMTSVCLPEMRKYQYDDGLSLGSICAGAILSFLIPPSLGFIIFGILANVSIGALFMAGVFPGILTALLYIAAIYIVCRINPQRGPAGPGISWKERLVSLRYLWGVIILIIIIFGGIYSGFVTPTEAGGIAAFGAIVIGLVKRRLTWKNFVTAALSSIETTGMVFILLVGAWVFAPFLSLTTIPAVLVEFMSGWSAGLILLFLLVFFFVGGLIFESVILMMITIPMFLPIWLTGGFDMVWLGVVIMLIVVLGNITPPFALIIFVVGGTVLDVPISKIFRGVLPFIPAVLVCIAFVVAFPQIATFLPNLMSPVKP